MASLDGAWETRPTSKIYLLARVEHTSACGDRKGGSLVAVKDGDGREP